MSGRSLADAELGVYSQNGEDGVLLALLERIGAESKFFVEFGIGNGGQGNCVLLADCYRWSGLFIEPAREEFEALQSKYLANPRVTALNASVTADNVEELFAQAGVPSAPDVLSIDIDGNDFWVWQAIGSFRPRLAVIEYNAHLPLDAKLVMPRDDAHVWDESDYFGASLGALRELGSAKGYDLIHTDHTGVNAFFIRREDAPAIGDLDVVIVSEPNYLDQGRGLPRDPARRPFYDIDGDTLVQPSVSAQS